MEGFKSNPKMKSQLACFKEGGYVTKKQLASYEKREQKAEEKKDVAEDKKIVKKAIGQHESAKHKGEDKTEIKLKKGGRAKKETGTVKKYKAGGKSEPKKMARGGKFFNEEPDDFTAVPTKPAAKRARPKKRPAPFSQQGPVSDFERQQIMEMFQDGPGVGAVSDYESDMLPGYEEGGEVYQDPMVEQAPLMEMMSEGDYIPKSQNVFTTTTASAPGGRGRMQKPDRKKNMRPEMMDEMRQKRKEERMKKLQDRAMRPGFAGLGSALNTGALGGAAPAGSARNPNMTPQETDLMRGVQAIGSFYRGGQT